MFKRIRRQLRRVSITGSFTRIVLGVAVVLLVVAFAARWRVESRTRAFLDQLAGQAAPIGTLSYTGVAAGFDGELRISDLAFYPDRSAPAEIPPVITEAVSVRFPDFLALVTGGGDLPRSLTLQARGMRVEARDFGTLLSGNPAEALACGAVDRFEMIDLDAMGLDDPSFDLSLGYQLDLPREEVALEVRTDAGGIARTLLEVELGVPGIARAINRRDPSSLGEVKLIDLAYSLDATTFNRARNRYCAEQLGVDRQAAIDANVEAFVRLVSQSGWAPEAGLVDQYRAFIGGEDRWLLEASPASPVSVASLTRNEDDLAWISERLGLATRLGDGEPVPVTLRRLEPAEIEAIAPPPDPAAPAVAVSGRWVHIPPATLEDYVNRNVSIETRQGKEYVGELLEVDGERVVISTRLPGGQATLPIARAQVARAEIYERR